MREYGQDYWSVLKLPLVTFWSLNRQVNRLRAEEDIRSLRIHAMAQSAEASTSLGKDLQQEIDSPVRVEKGFDEEGFLELQRKFHPPQVASETHTKVE